VKVKTSTSTSALFCSRVWEGETVRNSYVGRKECLTHDLCSAFSKGTNQSPSKQMDRNNEEWRVDQQGKKHGNTHGTRSCFVLRSIKLIHPYPD
jgi:hypothetical protein